jgi:hypothetical protein
MKALRNRRVAVVAGDGVVARSEYGLVIVHGHPDAIDTLLADAPFDTATGIAQMRRAAAAGLPTGVGGIVVVTEDGGGIEVTSAGPEHVSVEGIEPTPERQGDARIRQIHHTGVVRLGVPLGHAGAAHDLREGLVPGSGVVLSAVTPPEAGDAPAGYDHAWAPQDERVVTPEPDPAAVMPARHEKADITPEHRAADAMPDQYSPADATPDRYNPADAMAEQHDVADVASLDAEPSIDPDPAGRASFDLGLDPDPDIDPDPTTPLSERRSPTQLTDIQPPPEPESTQIPPQPSPASAEPATGGAAFELFDLSAAAHPRPPLPTAVSEDTVQSDGSQLVRGILCSRQHFNNPLAPYCQVCGISMAHVTPALVERPRPTLGFIVFDDGTTFALDRSYALGRELPEIDDPDTTPLVIDDPEHSVSRRHAELRLDGWDVIVRDIGSSNGTRVWDPPSSSWQRLQTGEPLVLGEGTYVAVGRRVFVYEPAVPA